MLGIEQRSTVFADVAGQAVAKKMLGNIRTSGEYPKALFLSGPSGIGKTTLARIFARSAMCPNPQADGSPCNSCRSCLQHLADAHPNYVEVDAASHSGKDDMEALQRRLSFESDGMVVIVLDESHNISKAGKDALLKMLETAGHNDFMVMFCSSEPDSMPETLLSRSITIPLSSPSDQEVASVLKKVCTLKGFSHKDEALTEIAAAASGNVRLALHYLQGVVAYGEVVPESVHSVVCASRSEISKGLCLLGRDLAGALDIFDRVLSAHGSKSVYRSMLSLLVDAARYGASLERWEAPSPAKEIWRTLPKKVHNLIDYVVSRQRFEDQHLFRSDIVVMHTRYLKGEILDVLPDAKPAEKSAAAKVDMPDDPWERMDAVRIQKEKERKERLSGGSGGMRDMGPGLSVVLPETTNSKPVSLRRS